MRPANGDEPRDVVVEPMRRRDLRRGVIFLSLGVAGLLCSLFFADAEVVSGIRAGSMFPLLLGAGFLIVWRLNTE